MSVEPSEAIAVPLLKPIANLSKRAAWVAKDELIRVTLALASACSRKREAGHPSF